MLCVATFATLTPWFYYQYVSIGVGDAFWGSDLQRVTYAASKSISLVEQGSTQYLEQLWANTKTMVFMPYVEYVTDVPPKRNSYLIVYGHYALLASFFFAIALTVRNAFKKRSNELALFICLLLLTRQGIISSLSDSPRYLVISTFLFIFLVAIQNDKHTSKNFG